MRVSQEQNQTERVEKMMMSTEPSTNPINILPSHLLALFTWCSSSWQVSQSTELRFVHFLSDFFKAGTGEQDIQNPKKVWKVTCKIARVFAEICRFYQKVSLKWPHFTHKVTPFFSFKNILFPDKNEFLEFLYK